MTKTQDRTVQVPVSQLVKWQEDLAALLPPGTYAIKQEIAAALSQPIPTAEPCKRCGGARFIDTGRTSGNYSVGTPCPSCNAEPPRPEDMAPGTTFTACWRGHVEPDQFVVLNDGVRCIAPGRWYGGIATEVRYATDRIDPSTIRDVTPPAKSD